jgi:hypothetical protein
MRILRADGAQFYLGRIKDNKLPGHVKKTKPVQIVIENKVISVFSNPLKSNYAYLQALGDDEWFAVRDHKVADTTSQQCTFIIKNHGRPFKRRNQEVAVEVKKPREVQVIKKKSPALLTVSG